MMTDIQIAQAADMQPIEKVAEKLGFTEDDLERFGKYKAKVSAKAIRARKDNKNGRLVLVTAISPTPAGEGKTTISIGLADALQRLGNKAALCLREPSLGPVFGVKGGAAGGGYSQVVPMEDLNLHFTGDFHAIGIANNLLAALIDNHIYQGNALGIDPKRVVFHRAVDLNERELRKITIGLGARTDGIVREDGFDITAASEVMAAFCMSSDLEDLKARLGRIIVGYTYGSEPVTAADLKAQGAMAALLKEAIQPNLIQTLEHTPAFIHGGPFANIAHGCNSVIATKLALKSADIVVTEAGFAADLGAEKFIDIKCRQTGLAPDAVVVVCTIRALKYHGGVPKAELGKENVEALKKGSCNLARHIENIKNVFGLPAVVAINRFPTDTDAEIAAMREICQGLNVPAALSTAYSDGGQGAEDLAKEVMRQIEQPSQLRFTYELEQSPEEKIAAIAKRIYRADNVVITKSAQKQLDTIKKMGKGNLPVCVAKTQYSFSDDPTLLGAPEHFEITVRSARLSAGAGFIVALTGEIMTLPGLPKVPAAEAIDIDEHGNIVGLF